eukprot:gnl/TRDRNA2_/TRDRNA2_192815_c0_seq1.p1 gnl/TRDRNA2_/TRDRNA2_192815_c0~~gnl/TRDRNA2_/TRDRNA2_192815_c0_seq1.p1  ORF type:complete len:356 (+),score=71.79 gnl/TRDRNA2_/TRDRNA2_192815_c0_seq1:67-1134(+)
MPMLIEELIDDEQSVSMTWSVDFNGTLRHKPSGIKVSPDTGIECDGHACNTFSPKDIEMDAEANLGVGSGGVVKAGMHRPSGTRVAVKAVKVDNREKREQMLNEIRGLISAEGCPHLVQWYAGFVGRDTGLVHVVVELMDLGSLADLRRRVGPKKGCPPDHLACIAAQVIRGLRHLQTVRLLHRDVKPANILHNTAGEVKLTDFGISKEVNAAVNGGLAQTFLGTATYMSPERALGKDYSFNSDIWSAGMVIYELATGSYPFPSDAFLELYDHLCVRPEPRLDPGKFPAELCEFVAQCLTREEARRPDAQTLCDHELINPHGVEQMATFAKWLETVTPASDWKPLGLGPGGCPSP